MYYIIGLGNPGTEYIGSRHNVGFAVIDAVYKKGDFSDWKDKKDMKAQVASGEYAGKKVTLIKPQTYMNLSGTAVSKIYKNKKDGEKILVIHDELDLPLGKMKISFGKKSGGHRGVESLIKVWKSDSFGRLRIGISNATSKGKIKKPTGEEEVVKWVLGKFKPSELDEFKNVLKKAEKGCALAVSYGAMLAMNEVNKG
jgi:PTH1 family peptidyl-tRNA hydrolase